MIEHVGHEFMEVFFSCCESVLAEDRVVVCRYNRCPGLSHFQFDSNVLAAKIEAG